jgi:DNA gyrase subunit A
VVGRATQGVRLIELRNNDQIAAVAKVDSDLHEDEAPAGDAPASDQPTDGNSPDGTDVASGEEPNEQ